MGNLLNVNSCHDKVCACKYYSELLLVSTKEFHSCVRDDVSHTLSS